ncbi:MAG: ATP-dependent RecD-like DNA helicase [Clostridium sp.]|nr:ATP-dependent RecD-like DNA helicase [Clostridium sp.]MCM1444302.1 ATP-dependent RecD-like DNA helicase [Candidatus Amulumruptor caecigallinarius]
MDTFIKGSCKKIIFSSSNGYVIGLAKVIDTNKEDLKEYINRVITFTGTFFDLQENDTYIFYGDMVNHPKYGIQFSTSSYERIMPQDKDGIISFLSSSLFNGIGEKMATSIVEHITPNTLDKILEDKTCLYKVPKLSKLKADRIYDTLVKYEDSHKTIVYLNELGFTMKDSLNIYNYYRENTILQIENNIFKILDNVEDISFMQVDLIRKKLNVNDNDENRIKSCIIYFMKNLTYSKGDTYLNFDEIYNNTLNYLKFDIDSNEFKEYLEDLKNEEKIIIENDRFYLKEIYCSETRVIDKINDLLKLPKTNYSKIDKCISTLQEENQIIYDEMQIKAIKKALKNNLLVITGGPGTGKTTIIKTIVELYKVLNDLNYDELVESIALLAPTGRASKRLSEATLFPSTTIHRFLGWNKDLNKFKIDEYNKSNCKFIIIDEVSMVDISLLDSLFKGLVRNVKILLVGDINQLPSVGPGQVLKDIIESEVVDVIKLDLLYRQSQDSYIPILAREINQNDLNENFLDTKEDYTFLKCSSVSLKNNLSNLCKQVNEKNFDYRKFQVMAPIYATQNGIDELNKMLQDVFNPSNSDKRELKYSDVIFRENDKILQLVNMPEENVFNGDIGIIKYIIYSNTSKSGKDEIYVDYDGNIVKYLPKDFNKIKHGYVVSIHKSQGSEYDLVILPMVLSYGRMLYRKLVYTAVTRAKKKLIIIGEVEAFVRAVSNNQEYIRKTSLKEKLISTNNF